MKIYCILFDTFPRHPKMEELFKSKNLHYSDYLTSSSTVTTMISMLAGVTPSDMRNPGGIGHSHTYASLPKDKQEEWNRKIILKDLPDDWNIHLHSMPRSRGDDNSIPGCYPMYTDPNPPAGQPGLYDHKCLPDIMCGRFRDFKFYDYNEGEDEQNFMKKMQDLSSDENHFIVLKYNHYHDLERGKHDDVFELFKDIINKIDFEEENSLFWLFADHGEPPGVDALMSPPDSWLTWCSITDNITNKKVEKDLISMFDFKTTVLNRIYNRELPNDVLDEVDMERIYVSEDGRGAIDEHNCTTVSAIKYLGGDRYIQYATHNPRAVNKNYDNIIERTIIYDKSKKGTDGFMGITNRTFEIVETNDELKNYLKSGIWKWYFTNE